MASTKIKSSNFEDGNITFVAANDLRKGDHVILRSSFPCKLVELAKYKTGKHGTCKIRVVGIDIFTSKKYDDIFISDKSVLVPIVTRIEYDLLYILEDEFVKLKLADGTTREDLRLDIFDEDEESTHNKIMELYSEERDLILIVTKALNHEKITGFKFNTKLQSP